MKRYKDIFFDFDDTLYDTHGNAVLALSELYDQYNLGQYFDDPKVFYDSYWYENVVLWSQYAKGEIDRDYLIVERFRRPLSVGMCPDGTHFSPTREFCLEISDVFLDLCSCKPGVIDGAHEIVEYLHDKGYRLHICSNGFHEVQYKKLKSCGLFSFFDSVILSEDAGFNKPHKEFFDYAMKMSSASVDSTIMIGDNFFTDIIGAKNYGLDTLFFNAHPDDFTAPEPVTFEVNRLLDIKNIL